jgi:hypothetical protein
VTETDPALNIWSYDYTVAGESFGISAGYTVSGFDVYFDPALYASLDGAPAAPNADWLVFTVQPDPILPVDGAYTAQAVVDGASLTDPFSVSFTWLGAGTPGSQPFDTFGPSFALTGQGVTTLPGTAVPEPAAMAPLAAGMVGLLGLCRIRRRLG